ncbi:hypothetical protein [Streptosporangium sp. NPDC000509]|uniref:hypothetical protein n=1 Tax=Streptosporangium sp. NPDC000509 TaxID=3366186 RepID=UPI0036B34C58
MGKTTRERRNRRQRWEAARAREGARAQRRREAARAHAKAQEQHLNTNGSSSTARRTGEIGANLFVGLGMLMLLFALVGFPVLIIDSTVPDVRTALGMEGEPGTATVLSCSEYRRARRAATQYDCKARFVFEDPARAPIVIQTVADTKAGETFPAAISTEGDHAIPTGTRGVWRVMPVMSVVLVIPAILLFSIGILAESRAMKIGAGVLVAVMAAAMTGGFALGR